MTSSKRGTRSTISASVASVIISIIMVSIVGAVSSAELRSIITNDSGSHTQVHSKIAGSAENILHTFRSDFREDDLFQFIRGRVLFLRRRVLLRKIDAAVSGSILANLLNSAGSIRSGQLARFPIVIS